MSLQSPNAYKLHIISHLRFASHVANFALIVHTKTKDPVLVQSCEDDIYIKHQNHFIFLSFFHIPGVGGVEGVSGCKETSADKSKLLVNIVEAGIHECVRKDYVNFFKFLPFHISRKNIIYYRTTTKQSMKRDQSVTFVIRIHRKIGNICQILNHTTSRRWPALKSRANITRIQLLICKLISHPAV